MSIRESAVNKLKQGNVTDLTREEKYFLIRQCAKVENYERTMRKIRLDVDETLEQNTYVHKS